MITNTIRAQYGGQSHSSYMYSKPYTKHINYFRMPVGYQPPKFEQFDGKGNPKQHIAHFVETCNNVGTEGDLLVKQFVCSLKGNTFEWYTDLEPESIDSWEQMEREFLNRFYCTRRTVSMIELTNTEQWKGEPVVDYINCWWAISLDCKDRLSNPPILEKPSDKKDVKKGDKFSKGTTKDAMMVTAASVKITARDKKKEVKKEFCPVEKDKRPTLKELQAKKYPFLDSDVLGMLEDLLEKKVIRLPECKHPKEIGRVNDPKYCQYHRIVSHPTEKCFVLKELLVDLASQNKILLDLDEAAESNHTTIIMGSQGSPKSDQKAKEEKLTLTAVAVAKTIQFGSLEPVIIQVQSQDKSRKNKPKVKPAQPRKGHGKKNHHQYAKRKGGRKMKAKKDALEDDEVEVVYMVSTSEEIAEDEEQNYAEKAVTNKEVGLLTTLKEAPPRFSLREASQLLQSARLALVQVLTNHVEYEAIINEVGGTKEDSTTCASCYAALTFTDEDLQLGSKLHNRPLFVSGYIEEQKIGCILID
ncbi:hypothetical protein Vadar_000532 [Vaccinium darrowii]|nr:hypothetical protein Vadar_000532 [Vaccinium darrowii]